MVIFQWIQSQNNMQDKEDAETLEKKAGELLQPIAKISYDEVSEFIVFN